MLAVGQADQPGQVPLPGTVVKLDKIEEQVGTPDFTRLADENATPAAVLNGMKLHAWVHLACHALPDASDPAASAFQLHNGQLDLATITREALPNADLAFLPACKTTTGDEIIPDEAVHLAAGMLMSGYRSVIATMWSVQDKDAPMVAEYFYSQLMKSGGLESRNSANALHDALGHVCKKIGENKFGRWVPYIHIGH